MIARVFAAAVVAVSMAGSPSAPPKLSVEFPFERIPRQLWARELIWLKNIGVEAIAAPSASAEAAALAAQAKLSLVPLGERRVSVLKPNGLLESRRLILANQPVMWTQLESESAPEYRKGAVTFSGEEDDDTNMLRREAAVLKFWGPVLSGDRLRVTNKLPDSVSVEQKAIKAASALSLINSAKKSWTGSVHVALPSYSRNIEVPNVTVPAEDALLLPVDVSFADPRFCRFCSGMSNTERLLYATDELTAIEYENGILSFEFYAPVAGVAVLQLERKPNGPMLAAGHPIEFDWDPENKRARLPIPIGMGANKHVRIAVTMTAPDDVASFIDVHKMVIGQVNHFVTDYSSESFAKRSRLIAPPGWKVTSEEKSPTQIAYAAEVPANKLHGDYEELRLEADGIGMSHVRVQLLRPVSVHVEEASALHFDEVELASDPPVIPVEAPNGRTITVQLRNNAPEIRTFRVALTADQPLSVSPDATEISIGASMERDVSFRVFTPRGSGGLRAGAIHVTGAVVSDVPVRFVVIPRGESVTYRATLTGAGPEQTVWENARIRAVFSKPDGGRWLALDWKESGANLLPATGVPLDRAATVKLHGDELTIEGPIGLPKGGKTGNVEWTGQTSGSVTRYRIRQ